MKHISLFWTFILLAFLAWGVANMSGQNRMDAFDVRVADVERRITDMENQHLSERLTRLETLLDTNNRILEGVFGALLLLLLERAVRFKLKGNA